jgi:hypothetical protein
MLTGRPEPVTSSNLISERELQLTPFGASGTF